METLDGDGYHPRGLVPKFSSSKSHDRLTKLNIAETKIHRHWGGVFLFRISTTVCVLLSMDSTLTRQQVLRQVWLSFCVCELNSVSVPCGCVLLFYSHVCFNLYVSFTSSELLPKKLIQMEIRERDSPFGYKSTPPPSPSAMAVSCG